ncbi:Heterochromatin protein 1-binding protein 3 [Heterocephalus glaber]|uniref:Heterochromatin protein 1-binding protein 3 n=1 Tax=Heterocephalus glaber TaxID=10181 RepID=G5C1T3_HETGA|nr:Heterochromatin protein 1-binding protein 3 [Heterocephalus glaber]
MEYAILSAIAAMNEPKTCSTTALKKYVLENHPGTNSNYQMSLLKKTLQKCEKNGWMEQISGKGFSGTFQICFPCCPSPGVLFPKEEPDDSKDEDEDEDESSEEDFEDEEPPPKRRLQKKTPPKSQGKVTPMKQRGSRPAPKVPAAQPGKARHLPEKAPPKSKTPTKKARPSPSVVKKPSSSSSKEPAASVRKEVKLPGKGKSTMKKSFKTKK